MTHLRKRKRLFQIDQKEVYRRVKSFYDRDIQNRDADRSMRLERYAKFRMWVGNKDWPWENASNIPLSDMMEQSLRAQDTIHNAVMSARPIINAIAMQKADKEKEQTIDDLIDYQVFEENEGEKFIGDAADAFINDGVMTIFCPWVKETRETTDVRVFDPIPENISPIEYFRGLLGTVFPTTVTIEPQESGWDFKIIAGDDIGTVNFFTDDDENVEMVIRRDAKIFDGPSPRVIDYDDILHPVRVENLQIPGPSNPGGSSHVILIDNPSVDEIKRLKKDGFYNLMTQEDLDSLKAIAPETLEQDEEDNKDRIAGQDDEPADDRNAPSHKKFTRLLVFDTFDVDGDGIDEDVMFWVILELKRVVRASYLGEMYPMLPPRRPFGEAALVPIRGRRTGISMLEMLEGLHDVSKAIMDQAVDAGTIANVPFFFYRAAGGMRPEVIKLEPGAGYPLSDPVRDVHFPQIGNPQAQNFALNMITLLDQMKEKTTVIGDLQFGRVPAGKSSALRTASGIALLSGQGEARPERILRRFFTGMVQVWELIHSENEIFLPKEKQYRISGVKRNEKDPYRTINERSEIIGRFDFGFKASVLNTSKQDLQSSLQIMLETFVSDLAIQLGIIDSDGIYRLMRDFGRSLGQDADAYLREPLPGAGLPRLLADEAIHIILTKEIVPRGRPAEGAQDHMQKLIEFMNSPELGFMSQNATDIFGQYLLLIRGMVAEEAQQQQLLQAANTFGGGGTNQGGRPPEGGAPDMSTPPVNNELIDETLNES